MELKELDEHSEPQNLYLNGIYTYMDRNNPRTSVVIEVANQEEPEEQKTYQIDFDDLDIPKDYVIDQIFCGENITVYALFEVPEDTNVTTDEQLLNASDCPKAHEGYRFFHSASKKVINQRKLNGFRHNIMNSEETALNMLPTKEKESFYCLKHLNGDYDLLTPEREDSDLKVLFSKSTISRHSKSGKYKAVSKGVNTDIVQSPRIIQEVEKAVKQNIPFSKAAGVKSISSSKPSYEVIEMEMRQSFSSLSSYGESKRQRKNSVPNFFLVPLLMKDDGVLSHFHSEDKIQKHLEQKELKTPVVSEKVSMGTNTDVLMLPLQKNEYENHENVDMTPVESVKSGNEVKSKQSNTNSHGKLHGKSTILGEIKKLQGKLNALVRSLETEAFEPDTSELDSIIEEPPDEKVEPAESFLTELKSFKSPWKAYDELPILSTLSYPPFKTEKKRQPESPQEGPVNPKDQTESPNTEVALGPTKSISVGFISEGSSKSQITRGHSLTNNQDSASREDLKKFPSTCSIIWSELENRKMTGLSKSTTNTCVNALDPKFNSANGLKKSFSFDLRDVKLEVTCLKKIKNTSFKLDTKPNIMIPQTREAIMKCEMGDEACNKQKSSKVDLLSLSKGGEDVDLKLEQKSPKKDEEGDAKMIYSKQNLLSEIINRKTENIEVHFCNTVNTTPQENILTPEKILPPTAVKSKVVCSVDSEKTDESQQAISTEKPTTPNKNNRKLTPTNQLKKEVKIIKKVANQVNKTKEKIPKADVNIQEAVKQRILTGSRKFTLKGAAETRLHVDRLIKPETPPLPKGDRKPSRLPCKREPADPSSSSEEKAEKMSKTNRRETKEDEFTLALDRIGEDSAGEENSLGVAPNQPGIFVELLAEKPSETSFPGKSKKCPNLIKIDGEVENGEGSKVKDGDDSLKQGKPIVKSVWALTKVLLFEDGSKKIEILEASLTPPGFSLPKNSQKENP